MDAGPVKIPNAQSLWAASWNRINAYIKAQLANNPQPKPPDPDPQPSEDLPPAGPITANEKANADKVVQLKPQSVPTTIVPSPDNLRKQGQSDADWFANVAWWATYRDPEGAWRKAGMDAGPVKIPNAQSLWAASWNRINAYIKAQLANNPQPEPPDPDPQPDPQNDVPPQGTALTLDELSTLQLLLPLKLQEVGPAVVPPPDNVRKLGQTEADWQTNVIYWATYRNPESKWVKAGRTPAPVKLPPGQSPWVAVWLRINARVKLELAQQPDPNAPNNEPPPAGNTITAAESAAIDLALAIMMQQVEAAVVPPPDNVKKPTQTEADWQTNVVYWTVYRSPGSAWVKSNHPPAPVKIPAQSPWRSLCGSGSTHA
jgi:hypothetical protein